MLEGTRRGDMAGGIWIRRVGSPAVTGPPSLVRAAAESKENTPPVTWRRMARRSPLPRWYPRTPLKDITALINNLEWRRLREQEQAARVAQANRDSEASSGNALLVSPPSQEQIVSNQNLSGSTTDPVPACKTSLLSPVEHPLQMSSASSSDGLTPKNMQLAEDEERLCDSIDQIEKIVRKNLKTMKKEPVARRATQRRNLVSLR